MQGGYGSNMQYVYILKRSVTNKERFDILHVKDHKNFITIENHDNVIEDLKNIPRCHFILYQLQKITRIYEDSSTILLSLFFGN